MDDCARVVCWLSKIGDRARGEEGALEIRIPEPIVTPDVSEQGGRATCRLDGVVQKVYALLRHTRGWAAREWLVECASTNDKNTVVVFACAG